MKQYYYGEWYDEGTGPLCCAKFPHAAGLHWRDKPEAFKREIPGMVTQEEDKPAPAQAEREAFEAWMVEVEGARIRPRFDRVTAGLFADEYRDGQIQGAWNVWQARAARPAQTEQQPVAVPQCVRDWYDAKASHVAAVDAYNARLTFIREHEPFGTSVNPEYQIMEAAERKARELLGPMFTGLSELFAAPIAQTSAYVVVMPPQCTDKSQHVKYRNGWNSCLTEVYKLNRARSSVTVPDGWRLVPEKPDIEMVEAGYEASLGQPDRSAHARVIEQYDAMLAAAPSHPAAQTPAVGLVEAAELLRWVVGRWHAEVANRPLVNVHRRTLDITWRQIIRHLGEDDVVLLGPRHDDMLDASGNPLPQYTAPIAQTAPQCNHRFMYFGDQTKRRCADCCVVEGNEQTAPQPENKPGLGVNWRSVARSQAGVIEQLQEQLSDRDKEQQELRDEIMQLKAQLDHVNAINSELLRGLKAIAFVGSNNELRLRSTHEVVSDHFGSKSLLCLGVKC